MNRLTVALVCSGILIFVGCANESEDGLSTVSAALGHGNGNHGTALTATLTAEVGACQNDNTAVVTFHGVLETSGSVDSAVIAFGGALTGFVLTVEPQDWVHMGRHKRFDGFAAVPFPNGTYSASACATQSGSRGRHSKRVCTDVTFVVEGCTCPERCVAYTQRLFDECVALNVPAVICEGFVPFLESVCTEGGCTCDGAPDSCSQLSNAFLGACGDGFPGVLDCDVAASIVEQFCREDFGCMAPDPCAAPQCGDGVCCVSPQDSECDADCAEPCQLLCEVCPPEFDPETCPIVEEFCAPYCLQATE